MKDIKHPSILKVRKLSFRQTKVLSQVTELEGGISCIVTQVGVTAKLWC